MGGSLDSADIHTFSCCAKKSLELHYALFYMVQCAASCEPDMHYRVAWPGPAKSWYAWCSTR